MPSKNRLAIVGLAAGLIGGGAAGIALTSPGIASGQSSSTDSTTSTTTSDGTGAGTKAAGDEHGNFLDDALAPLVKNGTITQSQADAVKQAIEDARPDRPHGPGFRAFGEGHGPFGDVFGAAAKAIGVSVDDLRAALRDGKSIADIAKS